MLKDRLALYWDMYKIELDTRDILNTQISLPIAITTINFGTFTYCIKKLTSGTSVIAVNALIIAIISTAILLYYIVISIRNIIKGYHNNYIYSLVPDPITMEEYYSQIIEYYSQLNEYNNTSIDYSIKIDEYFELYLISAYGSCCKKNILNNTIRSAFIYDAKTTVIYGLIISAIAFTFCNFNMVSNIIAII